MGSAPGDGCISAHLAGGSPTCCSAPPQVPSSIRQWRPAPPPGHTSLPPHSPSVLRAAVPLAAPSVAAGAAAAAGATLLPHLLYCATNTHSLSLTQLHSRRHLHQPHLATLAARTAHHGTHPAQGGPRPQVAHTRSLLHTRSASNTIILKISHGVSHSHWVNSAHYHLKPLTPVPSLTPYQLLTPVS